MWLCEWDAIYGIYPTSKAYQPDTEEPVITADGKEICRRCAEKYWKAREEAELLAAVAKAREERARQ